jgi:hypothetical protein
MTIPANAFHKNKQPIETTVGRYIFEMFVLPPSYLDKYGYVNVPFDGDVVSDVEKKIGQMILNDEMPISEFTDYMDNGEWISMGTAYFISPSLTYDFLQPLPAVVAKKNELFKKYEKELAAKDPNVASKIESELLDLAKSELHKKKDLSMDMYDQKSEFKFPVAYKKSSIMGGVVVDINNGGIDILKSNYVDGINKEDFAKFTNLTIEGGYSRGVKTQDDGYMTKKYNNAMQTTMLDAPGSDCGTKETLDVFVYPELKTMFLYRYIVEGGKLVLIDQSNIDRYVGKTIHMRSPMYCVGDKICNKCAGELYYKMGIKNFGLLVNTVSGNMMNISMKAVHDSTVKFTKIDVYKYIRRIS